MPVQRLGNYEKILFNIDILCFWKSELLFNQAYCQYLWGARHRRGPPPGGSENPRIRFRPGMSFPSIFCHYWSAAGPESRRLRLHRPQSKTRFSNPLFEPADVPAGTRFTKMVARRVSVTSHCPMKLQIAEGNRPDLEMAPSKNQTPKLPPSFPPF